jgi:SAM-dependent methyltransferase
VDAGSHGAPAARLLSTRLFPTLEGLVARLSTPAAAFLDVGTGVGALTVEMCHLWPQLRVVGLEPQEAPLAAAHRAVAAAGLDGRVELRRQRVEEMVDSTAFDLVWLPQVFLSQEALVGALPRVLRALRPGGWLLALVLSTPGAELRPALGRLLDVLWGGAARTAGAVESLAAAAGFEAVHTVAGHRAAWGLPRSWRRAVPWPCRVSPGSSASSSSSHAPLLDYAFTAPDVTP